MMNKFSRVAAMLLSQLHLPFPTIDTSRDTWDTITLVNTPTSLELRTQIARETDTIMLSFSCGKDSIGAWLALRPHFKRIIPVYMWLVPGLRFVEDSLSYYEDFFKTKIMRVPHPSYYRWLNNYVFQPPERCLIIDQVGFPNLDYDQILDMAAEDAGLKKRPMSATGVRAADSPVRRAAITKYGVRNENRNTFFAIWDWTKDKLLAEIDAAGVKLPVDYKWFGRSFDGIDRRFLEPLKQHAPDDYKKIIDWFPLAELDMKRRDYATEGN